MQNNWEVYESWVFVIFVFNKMYLIVGLENWIFNNVCA